MNIYLKNNICIDTKETIKLFFTEQLMKKQDILFLAGSLIESNINNLSKEMGNKESDIDAFIFTENIDEIKFDKSEGYEKKVFKTTFKVISGINYDIEIYDINLVKEMLAYINNMNLYDSNIRTRNVISFPEGWTSNRIKTLVNRLNYSIPLYNEDKYRQIKNSINFKKFKAYMMRLLVNEIDNDLQDIFGNICEHTINVSLHVTRNTLLRLMETILYYENQTIDRDKWIVYKFLKISEEYNTYENIKKLYSNLFLEDLTDYDKCKEVILNTIEIINETLMYIEL